MIVLKTEFLDKMRKEQEERLAKEAKARKPLTLEERYTLLMMIDYPTREEREAIKEIERQLEGN